jgi:hypothetical protein
MYSRFSSKVDAIRPHTQWRRGGGAILILDNAAHPPIAFLAGLPGGIQLSQLPDPRNMCKGVAAPDGWQEGGCGPRDEKSQGPWCLRTRTANEWMRTLRLGWVLHCKFKHSIFEKNKG